VFRPFLEKMEAPSHQLRDLLENGSSRLVASPEFVRLPKVFEKANHFTKPNVHRTRNNYSGCSVDPRF
jgi:hypothetical protein